MSNVADLGQTGSRPPSAVINTNNGPSEEDLVEFTVTAPVLDNVPIFPGQALFSVTFGGYHVLPAVADGSQSGWFEIGVERVSGCSEPWQCPAEREGDAFGSWRAGVERE